MKHNELAEHYKGLYLAYANKYDDQLERASRLMALSGVIAEMLSETFEVIDKQGTNPVLQKKLERVFFIETEVKHFDWIASENVRLTIAMKQLMAEMAKIENENKELKEKLTVVEKTFEDL